MPDVKYLAAVDAASTVQATSAGARFTATAGVFFVTTDPAWRGRGVGTAMTAAAIRSAAAAGARSAVLDASPLGLSIYRRLGFEAVGDVVLFSRG